MNILDVLLQMNNIDKYYSGVKALDSVCFEVQKGEVHALLGANGAGKSTLMKILVGELSFDSGTVIFDGKTLDSGSKWKQSDFGISFVHQEISVIPVLTVAQYMFLGREKNKCGLINDRAIENEAVKYLKKIGANILPSEMMGSLTVSQQQLVEIAKALTYDIKLLIMDEPTTALGEKETEILFDIIRELKENGVSIIYISHRLEEIGQIADRITILKDGRYVKTLDGRSTEKNELIRLLAGRDIVSAKKETNKKLKDASVILEVRNLETSSILSDINFTLRKGEVLGFAGLMGSGRTLTAKTICGIVPMTNGEILVNGKADNYANSGLVAEKTYEAIREDIIKSKKYVVGIIQHENSETAELRTNGFKDRLNELVESDPQTAGKVEIIVEVKPSPNDNAYKTGLEFLYEKNVNMVYGTNLYVTYQLFDAIQAAGNKYDGIKFAGYDTSEKIIEWLKMDNKAELIGAVDQNPYQIGKLSVETLIKIANGEKVEGEVIVPGVWYNRDNID